MIVDFSQFAGKTVILYSDAPVATPAADSRLDYYTERHRPDLHRRYRFHAAGLRPQHPHHHGVPRVGQRPRPDALQPGTALMARSPTRPDSRHGHRAIRASSRRARTRSSCRRRRTTAPMARRASPAAHQSGSSLFADPEHVADLQPAGPRQRRLGDRSHDDGDHPFQPKAIQELFTNDYGRMNATLGVELPFTNGNNQTTIPLGYAAPPTEIIDATPDAFTPSGRRPTAPSSGRSRTTASTPTGFTSTCSTSR